MKTKYYATESAALAEARKLALQMESALTNLGENSRSRKVRTAILYRPNETRSRRWQCEVFTEKTSE